MSANIAPRYPANGNLMLYNIFPYRAYQSLNIGIEDMIRHVRDVGTLGFNAVWINPLQAPGNKFQLHPDNSQVNGSLYAMADELAFNPLIFPNCSNVGECEEQLRKWTMTVRSEGMYPLFDLVLNHIGQNEDDLTPLQQRMSDLLLQEKNPRWPDIQGLDYYKSGSTKRGITTEPAHLDEEKIDKIFSRLWEPMIRRYIIDYGFMGVRVDAITHIPVPVQQRIFRLIQQLVEEKYNTNAIILGELMVGQPEPLIPALKSCGFTHCLHPSSYFWSPELEGGYSPAATSPFLKQTQALSPIVASGKRSLKEYSQLLIHKGFFDKRVKQPARSMHLFRDQGEWVVALNDEAVDVCFNSAFVLPVHCLPESADIINLLASLEHIEPMSHRKVKAELYSILQRSDVLQNSYDLHQSQKCRGSLVAVSGNHDVGTLLAKVMLDLAYKYAVKKCICENELEHVNIQYRQFKNTIKGVSSPYELLNQLSAAFLLDEDDCIQIRLQLQTRACEKLFTQAFLCSGQVLLAGDEFGVCHKPEVFSQFGETRAKSGVSLLEISRFPNSSPYDLRTFIRCLNKLLGSLPVQSYEDKNTPYTAQINVGELQVTLSAVVRTSMQTNTNYLLVYCSEDIPFHVLQRHLLEIMSTYNDNINWKVDVLNQDGSVYQCEMMISSLEFPPEMEISLNLPLTTGDGDRNNEPPMFFSENNVVPAEETTSKDSAVSNPLTIIC